MDLQDVRYRKKRSVFFGYTCFNSCKSFFVDLELNKKDNINAEKPKEGRKMNTDLFQSHVVADCIQPESALSVIHTADVLEQPPRNQTSMSFCKIK